METWCILAESTTSIRHPCRRQAYLASRYLCPEVVLVPEVVLILDLVLNPIPNVILIPGVRASFACRPGTAATVTVVAAIVADGFGTKMGRRSSPAAGRDAQRHLHHGLSLGAV